MRLSVITPATATDRGDVHGDRFQWNLDRRIDKGNSIVCVVFGGSL